MEHVDTGTVENWYANRALPFPVKLQRLAVVAPDDAPGLRALRQRLAQRPGQALYCDHYAAGFNGPASAALAAAFDQIRQRHALEPYDVVLLLDGSPDALGIAESNGLIPGQVCRTPAPVWTAIGEDDANTELGDVANRVFAHPANLIDALPLHGGQPEAANMPSHDAQAGTAPPDGSFSLVLGPAAPARMRDLSTMVMPSVAPAPSRGRTHPLVLCAAGAVILASVMAIAIMLGWLPNQRTSAVPRPTVEAVATKPRAVPLPTTATLQKEEPPAAAPAISEPVAVPASTPAPATAPGPQGTDTDSAPGKVAAAVAGAAGVVAAAAPQRRSTSANRSPRKRASRHAPSSSSLATAAAPRQVGSNEVPVVEFTGTKTRAQVIAEMMEARRLADRQAAVEIFSNGMNRRTPRR
jgi:hypothetical protein